MTCAVPPVTRSVTTPKSSWEWCRISKWRNFSPGNQLPATWTDGIEELLSTYASANFNVVKASATTIKVPAGAGVDQAGIMIQASPRWNAADAVATHPGGAAGTFDVYVICTVDTFGSSAGPPIQETDTTTRTFGLKIGAPSGSGAEALSRKVAQVIWDGATITAIIPIIALAGQQPGIPPIGSVIAYGGSGDPAPDNASGQWLLADGRLINKVTYAGYFARAGHAYNLGVDPGGGNFKIADKRGRGIIGADDMVGTRLVGSSPGAAGRILVANKLLGQNGGSERVQLAILEGAVNSNGSTGNPNGDHTHSYVVATVVATVDGGSFANVANVAGTAQTGGASFTHSHALNGRIADQAHQNLHPYEVDNMIVRVA